jgi:hypothetical protein
MHGERFDRLVKHLAGRQNRRQLLTGVAGIAAFGMVAPVSPAVRPALSAGEAVCVDDGAGEICPGSVDHAAIATRLIQALGPTRPGCLSGDAPCDRDDACCSGVCTMQGRCACFAAGHLCPSDGYCCGGVCRNGRCV